MYNEINIDLIELCDENYAMIWIDLVELWVLHKQRQLRKCLTWKVEQSNFHVSTRSDRVVEIRVHKETVTWRTHLSCERHDDIAQSWQAGVYTLSFLQPVSLWFRLFQPLWASQVHQIQSACNGRDMRVILAILNVSETTWENLALKLLGAVGCNNSRCLYILTYQHRSLMWLHSFLIFSE